MQIRHPRASGEALDRADRAHTRWATAMVIGALVGIACALPQGGAGGDGGAGGADGGSDAAAGITGAGCGAAGSVTICRATSQCPNVAVDGATFPDCGFRINGSSVELVCVCDQSICSMGAFATCKDATQILSNATEAMVCAQSAEGRCFTPPSLSGSQDPSGQPSQPTGCDRDCLRKCGGGAGCASVCNC